MASYSDILRLSLLANGESGVHGFADWGAAANSNLEFLEDAVGETASITLSGSNVTLSDAQERALYIDLTGTLSASVEVRTNDRKGFWIVSNGTSGAFTVTFKTTSGSGVVVPQGGKMLLVSDGTDVLLAGATEFPDDVLKIVDPTDRTKKARVDVAPISGATERTVTVPDRDIDLKNVPQVIASGTVSNQSSLDITGIPSDARRVIIHLSNIVSASDGVNLFARIDSGSGFISTSGTYAWSHVFFSSTVDPTKDGNTSASAMVVTPGFGTGANETGHCEFTVQQAAAGNIPGFFWRTELLDAVAAHRVVMGGGRRLASGSVEGVRFEMSTGDISCDYVVIAIRN